MQEGIFRNFCGEFKRANNSSSPSTIDPWLSLFRSGSATPSESELRLIAWQRFRRRTACAAYQSAN